MTDRKCPLCGSRKFFVREAADAYDTFEFEFKNGEVTPCGEGEAECPPIVDDTEAHCCRCTWKGLVASLPAAH